MNKLWLVALYEYQRNALKKSFLFAMLAGPLIIAVSVGFGLLLESMEENDAPVGYVDHAGLLADPLPAPAGNGREQIELIAFATDDAAHAALERGAIQAFYVLAADYFETRKVELFYRDEPGRNATGQFGDFLRINLLRNQPAEIARRAALPWGSVTVRSLDGKRSVPRGGPTFGLIMPLLISGAFLGLLMMSSGYLMQAVVDEKENRTIEVLATSISPMQLIGGKVLGIVAVSLTILAAWTVITILGINIAAAAGSTWFQQRGLDWGAIMATVAVGIPTYVLAAALMTAIGATVTSGQEGQSTSAVFVMLHMVPVYLAWAIIAAPYGFVATLLSLLPFTALLTLSMRNLFAAVPPWQIAVSFFVQTLAAVGAVWLAGRAFRLGMLRYGQRLAWRRLFRRDKV
jgi:ABC-2 type transport system permease protein